MATATHTRSLNAVVFDATDDPHDLHLNRARSPRANRNSLAGAALTAEVETLLIESDEDLHARVVERLNTPGESIPADELLGD